MRLAQDASEGTDGEFSVQGNDASNVTLWRAASQNDVASTLPNWSEPQALQRADSLFA